MAQKKGYILAFVAGIIAFVSLITPVAYYSTSVLESYIWMWGLYSWKVLSGDTDYNFSEDNDYLKWGIASTLLIVFAMILLFLTANKARKRKSSYEFVWVICGIMLIAAPLVYYFGLSEEMPSWLTDIFWDFYDFHFAFFGPFIAGGLAILAGFIK